MCYIFRQICPFNSEFRKENIATRLLLPPAYFLSPLTFWEARDQPEPGSFFPRMKDPGNKVADAAASRLLSDLWRSGHDFETTIQRSHQILASQQLIQKAHQCMSRNVPLSTLTPMVKETGDPEEGKMVQLKFMHLN